LAELKGVDRQTDIAVPGQPDAMGLVGRFVAIPAPVRVAAHIQNGWQALACSNLCRSIEIPSDIQARTTLVINPINHVLSTVQCPGDSGVQWRLLGQRREAQHVEILLAKTRQRLLPVLAGFYRPQEISFDLLGLLSKVILDHLIARLSLVGLKRLGGKMIQDYLRQETQKIEGDFLGTIKSRED